MRTELHHLLAGAALVAAALAAPAALAQDIIF